MQTISPTTLTPKEYVDQQAQRQEQKPENCANCQKANCLEALGYYPRWISYLCEVLAMRVRRFLCLKCRVSISCLPDFAQPYRVVSTATVEAGFKEESTRETQHWGWLIAAYWKRYGAHLPRLICTVANAFGPCPVDVSPRLFWKQLIDDCGGLNTATQRLVSQFGTCLFATYRCHRRRILSG